MAQTTDAKNPYGYLFQPDKKPTKTLDALLRGIANYIIESVDDKEEKHLIPAKLAAFYKSVGGNYDSLFVNVPNPSISWIYASIGCQHTLQPSEDDFQPPSVPALTPHGFVRWQSIEILLGPEEHVPFIQNAVRNFAIKNPDTGECFPIDLPTTAFPAEPDKEIEEWHASCAQKLKEGATPNEEEDLPHLPPRPKVKGGFAHVRPGRAEYFEPKSRAGARPIPFQHVSSVDARPVRPRLEKLPLHRARQFLAPEESVPPIQRSRRRSFPENVYSPEVVDPPRNVYPPPPPGPPPALKPQPVSRSQPSERARRHSHSHHPHTRSHSVSSNASTSSADSNLSPGAGPAIVEVHEEEEEEPPRRRSHPPHAHHDHQDHEHGYHVQRPHSHSQSESDRAREREREHNQRVRYQHGSPRQRSPDPRDPRVRKGREREHHDRDDVKRRSFPLPIPVDVSGKLSAPFMLGKKNRDRDERDSARGSRSNSRGANGGNNVRWKDLYGMDASAPSGSYRKAARASEEDIDPHQQSSSSSLGRRLSREEREREPELSRGHSKRRDRERERERERDRERERERERETRPRSGHSRRNSHEDLGRRSSDRDRDREDKRAKSSYRERERDDVVDARRRHTGRRGMSSPPPPSARVVEAGRRGTSPIRGADGRRYNGRGDD